MNFLQQVYKGKNDWWRGTIIICIFLLPYIKKFLSEVIIKPFVGLFPSLKNKDLFFGVLIYVIMLPLFILMFKLLHKRNFVTLITNRKKTDWFRFFMSFTIWGVLSLTMFTIPLLISPDEYKFNFHALPFLELVLICVFLVSIKVFYLTVLLRSYLLQVLNFFVKRSLISLIIVVILFSFLMYNSYLKAHSSINYLMLMHYVVLGFFLGLIIIFDDGIEIVLGMTLVTSFISVLFVGNENQPFKSYSLYVKQGEVNDYIIYIACFICYPLYFYFLSRLYSWNDWKQKLFSKLKEPNF